MEASRSDRVRAICREHGGDPRRLLDVARAVQAELGCVDDASQALLAGELALPAAEVAAAVTFYSFLSTAPRGRVPLRLCHDVIDELQGAAAVAGALEDELGIRVGQTTPDGRFSLEYTSCIGMSDQAPAILVGDVVLPRLGPGAARRLAATLKAASPGELDDLSRLLIQDYGDGNNAHDLVRAAVRNNIRLEGDVLLAPMAPGAALRRTVVLSPAEVVREIKTSRLRGRGGAGFPVGMKWELTRAAPAERRHVIANADEGEPGTFKDRVLLTERPDLLFEGLTVAGYATGARHGLLYLRAEYAYLRAFLESVLERRRRDGLLGRDVCGKRGFDFDVRIQLGAGAYICGEETALINSAEGRRADPRTRPPYPAQRGYLDEPTAVNNVETLCCAARIVECGSGWFASRGTTASTGTKLLSVSGDCRRPGVYEVPFGTPLRAVLELCGANAPLAVLVGGPSGQLVPAEAGSRRICFDDLATGGAVQIFGAHRDLLAIVARYSAFFAHESCGYCTPCRVGTRLLVERLRRIVAGRGVRGDLAYLHDLCRTIETASRCGLGQTAPHPVRSSLEHFRPLYEARLSDGHGGAFDLEAALERR